MTLKDKLQILEKEWTSLNVKITTKLDQKDTLINQKDQDLVKSNQAKQEAEKKLTAALNENMANEQVLERLIKEMQELSKNL